MLSKELRVCVLAAACCGAFHVVQGGVFSAGRQNDDITDSNIRVTAGMITRIEGMVQETTRPVYELEGNEAGAASAETYTGGDFGVDDAYPTIGLSIENRWKYFTFQFDTLLFNIDVDTVARRNYYIGVGDEVMYGGRGYTNMKIPQGTPFTMKTLGITGELRGLITPVTVKPCEVIKFVPWIDLGLMLFGGDYDIDAGTPTGTTTYMYPPEDFVVQYQMIESEGSITATDQTAEEILANRARFNKYATFTLESIVAMLGLTF